MTLSCVLQQCRTLRIFREELKFNEMGFDFFSTNFIRSFSQLKMNSLGFPTFTQGFV